MTSIVLSSLSSPLLPSMSVQLIRSPHLHCLSIVVWVCLCFFFLRNLHAVHCVKFSRLSFLLHVQTTRIFAGRLCLAELFDYIMLVYNVIVSCFVYIQWRNLCQIYTY